MRRARNASGADSIDPLREGRARGGVVKCEISVLNTRQVWQHPSLRIGGGIAAA